MDRKSLIAMAITARERAYAPYSHFKVGAALLDENGSVYLGCNIENAAYAPSICAERTAFAKAVSDGARAFKAIAIASVSEKGKVNFTYPCGVCRQVMREFCGDDFEIYVVNGNGEIKSYTLGELMPNSFGAGML